MTSCDKPVKGKFGNNGACYKALDLVKISKVSRRWEGKEGTEDCRGRENSRCKGPQWKESCTVENLRQAHIFSARTPSILHRNIQGEMNVRVLSAPTKQHTQMRVLGSLQNA